MTNEQAEATEEPISLRREAYIRFKEALFSGRIKPGDFLSQRDICSQLDVPLGPVREALKSLENEGIVKLLPKRGIRVIQIDLHDFGKAISARKLIEGEAAARFAADAPMDRILDIELQTLAFQEQFRNTKEPTDTLFKEKNRVDFLLHDSIMEFLDNPILTSAFHLATEHVRIFRLNIAANQKFFELPAIAEHLKILAAMKERDAEGARRALVDHLNGTFKRAIPNYD